MQSKQLTLWNSPEGPKYRKKKSPTLSPLERALSDPGSLRKAIDAHCYECQGNGEDPGTWRRVRECEIERCALHHVRRKK